MHCTAYHALKHGSKVDEIPMRLMRGGSVGNPYDSVWGHYLR